MHIDICTYMYTCIDLYIQHSRLKPVGKLLSRTNRAHELNRCHVIIESGNNCIAIVMAAMKM